MNRITAAVVLGVLLPFLGVSKTGGNIQSNAPKLRRVMTPVEFSRAGLNKLTPSELASFEEWLGAYTEAVAQIVRAEKSKSPAAQPSQTARPSFNTAAVIETCIDDDFEGWDGETIFKLCNGQIWQQSEYAYTYHYAYRPDVIIYKSGSGYRLKVEGVAETIGIVRIK
jgi:hypothetical protein